MCIVSFKERVKKAAIANAGLYELNYVNVEYLVCSEAFRDRFRIIKSDKGNYLHLIGVHTDLTAEGFFNKCTLGFAVSGRPKSLLKGNELDKYKKKEVDLVFRKPRGCKEAYSELIFGNMSDIEKYKDAISDLISEGLVTVTQARRARKRAVKNIWQIIKIPICFRTDNYSAKLKRIKLRNRMR